jgi:thiol-disulfide isomerase/thioredoxin
MKDILAGLIVAASLGLAFSACSGSANSQKTPADASSNGGSKSNGAEYPALSEKIMTAELRGLDESTSTIADRKGKVVLLNMWATWCGPCRMEMPTLVKLQEELGAENIAMIGLNVDNEPVEQINTFNESMKLNYELVWPSEETATDLMRISKQTVIPQSFVVDREGKLRGVFIGANPKEVKKMEKLVRSVVAE